MRRTLALALLLASACKKPDAAPTDAGLATQTLLPECEKLDGRANADDCYERHAIKARDATFCERVVGPRPKNTCFQRIASELRKPELCASVDESLTRTSCRSEVAKKKGDATVCKQIEKPEAIPICIREVARASKDPKICDLLDAPEAKSDCISALAIEKPELCEALKDVPAKDKCLSKALIAPGAPKDSEGRCDKITDGFLKDACWTGVATRQHLLLCDKVQAADARRQCFMAASTTHGDEATCPKIAKAAEAEICWQQVAVKQREPKVCEKITDAAAKKTCIEQATAAKASSGSGGPVDEKLKKGITRNGNDFTVTREAFDTIFKDQNDLSKSVRIVPEHVEGKVVGIRLFGIRSESKLGVLGFENGDRIEKVNGMSLDRPEEALELYGKLKTTSKFTVEGQRKGQPITLTYTVK